MAERLVSLRPRRHDAPTRALSPAEARARGLRRVDPLAEPPDPLLVAAPAPVFLLRAGLLPWRRVAGIAVVLCADPSAGARHLPALRDALGPCRLAHCEAGALRRALGRWVGAPLAAAAERRTPPEASCRTLDGPRLRRAGAVAGLALGALALWRPMLVLALLAGWAALTLLLTAALKLAAAAATLRRDARDDGAEVVPVRLPVISVLVPLYREREVAGRLLRNLDRLDYPRHLLDLCLVTEDDDADTRAAIAAATLPPWAQVIEVPEGTLRTKPRALNYALPFARGSIVGIYDAEDMPGPDHLRRVAATFARRGPDTACLQGALDFFNWRRNWVARCFALDYAGWFRVMLPGLARLGLALPLGGTTLFLRRDAIEAVGGWDAHNVTEDADLGIRLARAGYLTEIVPFATLEEANCRPWPWIRQRSRWLKGYAVTWAVHMRDPARLWRELGPRRFWAFQVMFLGTLSQFALAPVLWSFWLVPLGLPHPLAALLPPTLLVALSILFLAAAVLDIAYAALGARRAGKARLGWWAPALGVYFMLATVAAYRALWEVATCPFRWDKTAHGIDDAEEDAPAHAPAHASGVATVPARRPDHVPPVTWAAATALAARRRLPAAPRLVASAVTGRPLAAPRRS